MTNRDTNFVAKHEGKRPLASTRLTWERMAYDQMYLTDTLHKGVHWIDLVLDTAQCTDLIKTVINLLLAQKARNFFIRSGTITFSKKHSFL